MSVLPQSGGLAGFGSVFTDRDRWLAPCFQQAEEATMLAGVTSRDGGVGVGSAAADHKSLQINNSGP